MGGLRKNRDCIGLMLAWAILVQAVILSFTSGVHAATLAAGAGGGSVLCTTRAPGGEQIRAEPPHQSDWQCCATACRLACSATTAGLLPEAERVLLPAFAFAMVQLPHAETPAPRLHDAFSSRPRAPPLA
ncbi:MAG: DUF2946 family protein [Methyloceanibacter sp.]